MKNCFPEKINYMRIFVHRERKSLFYSEISGQEYSRSTIKLLHNMIPPTLEMAVDDDIIRKNPAKDAFGDYGKAAKEKQALTPSQQEKILYFVEQSGTYNVYAPMLKVMFGTGLRASELIGLTWSDIDTEKKEIVIDHQLVYKNYGDGCQFHVSTPKTESGIRIIPMSDQVRVAFESQKKLNDIRGIDRDMEIEGYKGFIFTAKSGLPSCPMPSIMC